MSRTAALAASLSVSLALPLALQACSTPPAEEVAAPRVEVTTAAASGDAAVAYTGTIHARIESELGFRVGGQIVERLVDPGQSVRRGQPLMRIDARDLALATAGAEQRARAAEADWVRADADARRLKGMVEAGAIAASTYDAARAAQSATAANRDAARTAAREAANQRSYATLVADADGVVTDVLAQPGQVVAAGMPVLRFAWAGAREALVSVPERDAGRLPQTGIARIEGEPGQYPVRLREVSGAADALLRTFAARYTLSGAMPALGATVSVALAPAGQAQGVAVPLGALHDPGSGPGVWRIGQDNRVSFVPVRVIRLGNEAASVTGLAPGTRIVALGAQLLHQGEAVRPAPRAGAVS